MRSLLARHPAWVLGLLTSAVGALAFRTSALLLDDTRFLWRFLPTLQSIRESWDLPPGFRAWFGPLHRPLSILSWQLDRALWGDDYGGFHLTQAIGYGLCVAAFVAFTGAMLRRFAPALQDGRRLAATWIAGGMFALHPMHVETAGWIATRHDVLFGFLLLYGWWAIVRGLEARTRRAVWGWAILAAIFGGLSVQAKETGYAFFPGALLLVLLAPKSDEPDRRGRTMPLLLPAAGMLAACLLFRTTAGVATVAAWHPEAFSRWLAASGWALTSTVAPLSPRIFYDPHPLPAWGWLAVATAVAWAVWGIACLRKGNAVPLFGLLLVGLTLAPSWMVAWKPLMSTIVADRYLLLPVGGAILALGPVLAARPAARWIAAFYLVAFGVVSTSYATHWNAPAQDLGMHMAVHAPLNVDARIGGVRRALTDDDLAGARAIYEVEPPPREQAGEEGRIAALRSLLFAHEERWQEAVDAAIAAVQAREEDPRRWHDLGVLWWSSYLALAKESPSGQGPAEMVLQALDALVQSVQRDPRAYRSWYYLGYIHATLRRFDAATEAFENTIRFGAGTEEAAQAQRELGALRLQQQAGG